MSPSIWQILIVVAIIVVLFGAKRLPGLGQSMGEAIRGFKKGISEDDEVDVTDSVKNEKLDNNKDSAAQQKEKQKEEHS